MYCVKCGVELADSEKKCPLCGTVVYHPDLKQEEGKHPYPPYDPAHEEFNRSGILFILSFLFLIPLMICLQADIASNGKMEWSGIAGCAILLAYIFIVLPLWFRVPNPLIFIPVDFIALGGYLLYIDLYCHGGWFLTLAFPIVGITGLLVTVVVALIRYLKKGKLFIFGGAFVFAGGFMMLIEFFVNLTAGRHQSFVWSLYPLTVLCLIGIVLLTIGFCRPLRESLHKKFFL